MVENCYFVFRVCRAFDYTPVDFEIKKVLVCNICNHLNPKLIFAEITWYLDYHSILILMTRKKASQEFKDIVIAKK